MGRKERRAANRRMERTKERRRKEKLAKQNSPGIFSRFIKKTK
jgi:hypothetical protein